MDLRQVLEELKRRRVVRAALAYAAAFFVVLQIADIVIPALGLADVVLTGLTVVGILGFPLAMALAWAVDLTPDGLERTASAAGATEDGLAGAEEAASRAGRFRTVAGLLGAFALVGGTVWWVARPEPRVTDIRALAVLPLDNLTGDETQAHFVDGLHDVLIGELSHLDSLSVISRTSVMRYRDAAMTVGEIGEELDVQALLEGSVFRHGDTVRVTVQLIRTRPEDHIWDGRYEGRLSQALALQSRVAESVAREIELALSETTVDYFATREGAEVDPEAQDAYLRAVALWRTRDFEQLVRAIELFEEAVELDPTFALGWAGLANGYTVASGYGVLDIGRREAMEIAERAARRALSLEPGLVEGRVALGGIRLYGWQDFRGAERELSRAVELAPSHAQAHDWLGDALIGQDRLEEALRHFRLATQLDPFSALMHRDYGRALAMAGRCDEAVPEAETALDLDPRHFYAFEILRSCALREGDEEEAARLIFRMAEAVQDSLEDRTRLRTAYESGGITELLARDAELFLEYGGPPVVAAERFARAGRVDRAFEALDRAIESRDVLLYSLRSEPAFEPLRKDPRWVEIIERLEALAEEAPDS